MRSNLHVSNIFSEYDPLPRLQPTSAHIPPLTVYMLGRFAVYRGNELIEEQSWKRRKAKSLFKLLLLAPNRQLLKDRLLEWLWPDHEPERATNNLHRTLFILRRVLQPDLGDAAASAYVLFKDGSLALNSQAIVWVDAEEFKRLIQCGRQEGNALTHYQAAHDLYQGDFLPEDLYEDWASNYRETLRSAYCRLFQDMAQLYVQQHAHAEAIRCLQDLLRLEPAHEEVHRDLMQLYMRVGQRHQALQLYQQARETLKHDLNVEPAPETTALYQDIVENRWLAELEPAPALPPIGATRLPKTSGRSLLVGRAAELQKLTELLAQAEAGHGSLVILSGEQGVGKSRLAEEVMQRARAAGMQVLYGAAYEQEGHLPYGPFVEAIRGALAQQTIGLIRERLGVLVDDLARLLPELKSVHQSVATPLDLELGQERQRLFDAVATTLIILAQAAPLVVFLDDLHAAGESSFQLLHYLARRITAAPILILCACREEEAQRHTPVAQLCQELLRNRLGQRLRLTPLKPAEAAQLCSELLERSLLPRDLAEALYQLTEGNPFFVQELVLALVEAGKIKRRDGTWQWSLEGKLVVPASVREVIGLRLGRLSDQAQRLAGLAAVMGREFSYELLQAPSQWNNVTLLDLLDELLNAAIVEETETGYRFHHGLIRQVIYDELTTHRRIWLHGQVAQALEQLATAQLDERAAILVYHYERAECYALALRWLIRAGDRAQATYAPREALDHYNRAMLLCREHPELATAETVAGLLKQRAQTYLTLSDFEAAIRDLEQLLDNNREQGDPLRKGEALYQLGIAHYWAHRLERAANYLDQAIELAATLHYDELHTKALKLRDILNSTQGNMTQVTSAEAWSPTDRPQSLPAEEHWGLAMLAHLRSDFETALYHAQVCVELGHSFANTFLTLGGYFVLGMSQASSGSYQVALDHLHHALGLSEAAGDRFWRARLLNTVGWVYRDLFDLEQAIQYDQASLELARAGEPCLTEAEGNALANLATDYLLLKDYARTRAYLAEGLKSPRDEPFMRWRYRTRMLVIQGRLDLAEGNLPGALAAADEALVIAQGTQARKNIARSCRLRGETLLAAGQADSAQAAFRHALSLGLKLKSPALIWPCHLALAGLAEAAGDAETASLHIYGAAEILYDIAHRLTDHRLYQPFLAAPSVQLALARAVCPVKFTAAEVLLAGQ